MIRLGHSFLSSCIDFKFKYNLTSLSTSWIIDSRASTHMSDTQSFFSKLFHLFDPSIVSVVDDCNYLVIGRGVAILTSSSPLSNVFCILNFSINLLSISIITYTLFCFISFFPINALFMICWWRRWLILGMRLAMAFTSLYLITFCLAFLAFSPTMIPYFSGIDD